MRCILEMATYKRQDLLQQEKCYQEARATRSSRKTCSLYIHSVVNNSELYGPTNLTITYNLLFVSTLLLFLSPSPMISQMYVSHRKFVRPSQSLRSSE